MSLARLHVLSMTLSYHDKLWAFFHAAARRQTDAPRPISLEPTLKSDGQQNQ